MKSLKNINYGYLEENGDKCTKKMDSHGSNRSTSKAPKNVTNKDFLSIFFTETQLTNTSDHVVKMFVYKKRYSVQKRL